MFNTEVLKNDWNDLDFQLIGTIQPQSPFFPQTQLTGFQLDQTDHKSAARFYYGLSKVARVSVYCQMKRCKLWQCSMF